MEKAPKARCDECPLAKERFAPGKGPAQADLVIVGEAPGLQEVHAGVPFTGRSGQLLDRVLKFHEINRKEVFVTNVCLCRPPSNATPPSAAIKACHPRLLEELRSRKPKTILALGNTAARALLDTRTGITELRSIPGQESPYLPGVRLIPTFHPAAALRQPDMFPSIISDIKKTTRVEVVWEYTKYVTPNGVEDALRLLRKQYDYPLDTWAIDIEVGIDNMGRKIDVKNPDWLCIGISHRPGAAVVYPEEVVRNDTWQMYLDNYLAVSKKRQVYQNGKFDTQHLWSIAENARVDEDTMLMHYATDERK